MRLLILLVIWSSCQELSTIEASREIQEEEAPLRESWEVTARVDHVPHTSTASHRRLEYSADYVAWYENHREQYQLLKRIDDPVLMYLYDANGDSVATVMADEVRYFDKEARLEASGGVVVHAGNGTRLFTESLQWHEVDRSIRANQQVRIVSPKEDVEGYGLVADESLKTYRLGRFTARIVVEE